MEDISKTYVYKEYIDVEKLKIHLYMLKNTCRINSSIPEFEYITRSVDQMLYIQNIINKVDKKTSLLSVKYSRESYIDKRLYSNTGIQSLNKSVRKLICSEYYSEIDIVNCHPTILMHLFDEYKIKSPLLKNYVHNKEEVIKIVLEEYRRIRDITKLSEEVFRYILKISVLKIIRDYNNINKLVVDLDGRVEWVIKFRKEIHSNYAKLIKHFPKIYKYMKYRNLYDNPKRPENESSLINTTMTFILNKHERIMMDTMLKYMEDMGFIKKICVLMFDGILFPKNTSFYVSSDKHKKNIQKEILKKTNMNIKIRVC